MNDLHDDVKAAFDTVAADEGAPGSQVGSPPSEVLPPVEATPPIGSTPRPRDKDGHFIKADAQEPKVVVPATPPVPGAKPQVPPVVAPAVPPAGETPPLKLDPSKPPSAWTPAIKEKWNSIPQDIREEITRREEATAVGIQKLQQHYEPADTLLKELSVYEPYVQHIQAEPAQYLHEVIQTEQTLRLGNPAQKLSLLLAMGDKYGIPLRGAVDQALNGKLNETLEQAHRLHRTPAPIPPQVRQQLTELEELKQWRQGLESTAAKTELDTFAADHPLLPQVSERMAQLLESGACTEYQDAYDMAVYLNPQLRAQSVAQQNGQRQANGIQQRQAAAASVVAPGSAPLDAGGDGPGDTDDIHEAVRRAWNQSSGRA